MPRADSSRTSTQIHAARTRRTVRYKAVLQHLKALFYDALESYSVLTPVPTLAHPQDTRRFPCVEALLGPGGNHDATVSIVDQDGREHLFLIVCKVGQDLPVNRSLRRLLPNANWRGSVLVVKMGQRIAFTSMTTADIDLASKALTKFIEATDGTELPAFVEAQI